MLWTPQDRIGVLGAGMQVHARAMDSAESWWLSGGISAANCIAAYQPKGAASLAASYSNLANPGTYDAAPGVAPTWDATNGWIFNGSSQYLTIGTGPTDASAWSMIIRFSGGGSEGAYILCGSNSAGGGGANSRFWLAPTFAGGVTYGQENFKTISPILTSGVIAIAGQDGYRNGVDDTPVQIGTSTDTNGYNIFIGARNNIGSAASFTLANVQAFAVYNTTISAAQVLAVTNAMNAL